MNLLKNIKMKKDLNLFFSASKVVIFGLSPNPENLARNIIINSKRWNYSGKLFGVSPIPGENQGIKIYTNLSQIPEKPELALVFTKANLVPNILLECADFGIRHIAVSSAGFEETNKPEGIELAHKIKTICKEKGLYLVGPNGIATANTQNGLCLSFMPLEPSAKGNIAFITQSGGIGTSLAVKMASESFPLGKFVSLGNKTVLDEVDFLDYFINDAETKVICAFLEDLRRGREFLEVASHSQKPIIVYKANITPYGEKTASSHTASLSNDDQVLEGAFNQVGIIRARSLAELLNSARGFTLPPIKGNRLLIISPSGGLSVILADLSWKYGFELPPLPEHLVEKYSQKRRAGIIELQNPLDLGDLYSAELQKNFIRELLLTDDFDAMVMAYIYRDPEILKFYQTLNQLQRDLVKEFNETIELTQKPTACILAMPTRSKEPILKKSKYHIFDNPEDAMLALATLRNFYQKQNPKS